MPPPSASSSGRPAVISLVLLPVWIAAAAWASYTLATSWPYVGSFLEILLLVAVVGILLCAFNVFLSKRPPLAGWKRLVSRVVLVIVGFFAAGSLWGVFDGISMGRFERAIGPLVTQVEAKAKSPCPPAATYTLDAGLTAYLADTGRSRTPVELHHDGKRFVLALMAYSMDMDGSKLLYDSRTRAWRKVHNNMLDHTGELKDLRKDLQDCRFELQP